MAIEKKIKGCFIFQIAKHTKKARFKSKNKQILLFKKKKEYLKFYTEITVNKSYMQFLWQHLDGFPVYVSILEQYLKVRIRRFNLYCRLKTGIKLSAC